MAGETVRNNGESQNWNSAMDALTNMPKFGEHMEDTRESWQDADPENLQRIDKMMEHLEAMGVRDEILKNPAAKRVIDKQLSVLNSKHSYESSSSADEILGNAYTITCESGDRTKKAEVSMKVDAKGNLTIWNGTAECRDGMYNDPREFGDYHPNSLNDKGYFRVTTLDNTSNKTILMPADGDSGYLLVYREHQNNYYAAPEGTTSGFQLNTRCDSNYSKEERNFAPNGQETFRTEADHDSTSFLTIMPRISGMTPANVDLQINQHAVSNRIDSRITMRRNSDTEMRVDIAIGGKKVTIPNCPIYSEYGTDELRAHGAVLRDAWEKADSNK